MEIFHHHKIHSGLNLSNLPGIPPVNCLAREAMTWRAFEKIDSALFTPSIDTDGQCFYA